jgi:hypothetical protein
VFSSETNLTTSAMVLGYREKIRTANNHHSLIGFVDPLRTWLGASNVVDSAGNPVQSEVVLSAAQIAGFSAVLNAQIDSAYDKTIGLEISLTPGAEQIFIRHSSGGYAGFDADGNWKVYTPGSAEYKVNRNLVFDVLGSVATSCLGMWTRAKTVLDLISPIQPRLLTNFISDLPKIFTRIDSNRTKDMEDALLSSANNVYYNLTANSLGKSLEKINEDRYAANHVISERNYNISTFDALISAAHAKYIPSSHPLYDVLTPRLLKAVMLQESNGDPKAGKGSYVGLFQLGAPAIKDVTGQQFVSIENYRVAEPNIDIGVQYIKMCCDIMLQVIKNKSNLSTDDKQDILMAALMGYNWGPYEIRALYRAVVTQSNTMAYSALEERFVNSTLYARSAPKSRETLNYAPNIMYIMKRISI